MKIAAIETFIVDAGWRPWIFVEISTDTGIKGYGECSDARSPYGIVGVIKDLEPFLIGKDPRAYEMRFWDMIRVTRLSPGGIAAKGISGIECALIDIKAKALGISVSELFGGPLRDRIRLYWSHCGTTRATYHEIVGSSPIRSMKNITELGKEVVRKGYTALKTNILIPGDPCKVWMPGFEQGPGTTDQIVTRKLLGHIENLIGTFREAVGPDFDINLDLNFNFKPESVIRVAKVLEKFDLLWLEVDMYDPNAIARIKQSTKSSICTGEGLYYSESYLPYFQVYAADIFKIDVPWNGFSQAKKVADLANIFQLNMTPHNYYSHLATFISANLCAVIPNVQIMEIDVDDVPWKDDLVTKTPDIVDGHMTIPKSAGWGTELNTEVAKKHPWVKKTARW